jgi:LuxR family transcriptional regulator, maltose regulon positive regulatory protein
LAQITGSEGGPDGGSGATASAPPRRADFGVPLETKLHPPGLRKEWVERQGLIGHLSGSAAKLILVAAPAGFGKTTLVAQWRAESMQERRFAWVSLGRADNDPVRLWRYVVEALQRVNPELGDARLGQWRGQPQDLTRTLLPLLVNELAAVEAPVALVLDDYHLIKERACHQQLEFLLLHLPPRVQLVVITRADPPLPLARMRAGGDLTEIRARELAFTPAQAAEFVPAVAGVQLSPADAADLVERTEGWPAGLYMVALSLRGHPAPHDFIQGFTGSNRFVVDFLTEEVLSRQPHHVRQFLIRTSILKRFTAALCDSVAGTANAAKVIDLLERENLFLVPLDSDRLWYRYHHLFAQMLRSQLARTEPEIVPELHRRASAWHRDEGSAEGAIRHALAGDDARGAVDLIARYWYEFVFAGRTATVRRWLRLLGETRISADPVAAHVAAVVAALSGDRDSLRRWLPVIEAGQHEGPLPDGMRSLRFSAAVIRAAWGFDGISAMRESAATAVDLEPDPASRWYAMAWLSLGWSLFLAGEPGAAAALERAVLSEASVPLIRMVTLGTASLVAHDEGRTGQAEEFANAARQIADNSGLNDSPQGSVVWTALGTVHAHQGKLEEARTELEHAVRSRRRQFGISPWYTVEAFFRLASLLTSTGERAEAAVLLAETRDLLMSLPDGTENQLARLASLEGRLTAPPALRDLAKPLTEREEAVLRLLRGPLSLREIGQELFLSANTIKTHTRAIYRKLGVSTRAGAVERGYEAGLLR